MDHQPADSFRAVGMNTPSPAPTATSTSLLNGVISSTGTVLYQEVCSLTSLLGLAHCNVVQRTDLPVLSGSNILPASIPGYHPADLQAAYRLPSATSGSSQTIAIVDAHSDPNAESDLAVYRSTFGLRPCSVASGCLTIVNQYGAQGSLPAPDTAWSHEISLDLDMVSAVCPNCRILLVEANSAYLSDLAQAVDTAATLGATVISNSYGASEQGGELSYESYYTHPGVPIVASSGDSAFGSTSYPASSAHVTAVGGTTLARASNTRGWSESAWSGSSGGCSSFIAKPAWQSSLTGCSDRMSSDVSAVADPNPGLAVYDTYVGSGNAGGWMVLGGTSAGAPIVAGVYALAGNGTTISNASVAYAHQSGLFALTSSGYSYPTGLGSPDGTSAF